MRTFAFVAFLAAISTPVQAVNLNNPNIDKDNINYYWAKNAVENGGYKDPDLAEPVTVATSQPKKKPAAPKPVSPAKKAQSAKAAKNRVDTSPVNVPAAKAALDPATKVDKSSRGVKSTIT